MVSALQPNTTHSRISIIKHATVHLLHICSKIPSGRIVGVYRIISYKQLELPLIESDHFVVST